jgi:2-haloacid dehalogenase
MTIAAVIFDAYGTLFDVYSVARQAEALFPGKGEALAQLWRERQIDYTRLRTLSGRYQPFSKVTLDALRYALARLQLPTDSATLEELMGEYDRLAVFGENRAALAQMAEWGLPLAILSNGEPALLERVLQHSGLAATFAHVLSADRVCRFKTAPEVYQLGPDALGLPASEILFVSSNGWDACGARWFGYQSFWINRAGHPPEELGITADASGATMTEVLTHITRQGVKHARPQSSMKETPL